MDCKEIHNINASLQCQFINITIDCQSAASKLDYMSFIFCEFDFDQRWIAILLCVLWLLLLFIGLGVTADDFLCPSLVVITKTLHLSQNIANIWDYCLWLQILPPQRRIHRSMEIKQWGVTFLAFGNGAPDIFSSVAGIEQSRPELVIGTLFGAGIFVTSVVAGSIVVSRPFKIMERPFLRDIIFYICASFWAFLRFYYQEVTIWHSIGFVVLYILYILVVIISRVIYNRYKEKQRKFSAPRGDPTVSTIPTIEIQAAESPGVTFKPSADEDDPEAEGVVLRRFSFRGSISSTRKRGSSSHAHHDHVIRALTASVDHSNPTFKNGIPHPPPFDTQISKTSLSSLLSSADGKMGSLKEFFFQVCPIDIESWPERKWYHRILEIIKSPVCLLLILTIPVVDYENDKSNWCRILNSLHCITAPMFILITIDEHSTMIADTVPLWCIVLPSCFILALIVFFTSSSDGPPIYHWVFGYVGFITSVMWIYTIASEIVSLLRAIGVMFSLSDAILGLTVLAWGNSIGDFISNLSVARQGYPRMGISACYGGPLLNLLLGIGIPYTVMIAKDGHPLRLSYTKLISLLYATLCVILVSTIVTMTALHFQAKRCFGILLLCIYVVFLVSAILLESNII